MSFFYGKNFIKSAIDKRVKSYIESRDGVIWSVDASARTCNVRIQGSNTNVIAKFPQNIKVIPSWLRRGNSVQISHRSGVRGYVYITGQGTSVPTAMSGDSFPDPGTLPDAILTGCVVDAVDPPSMGVSISSGTFRINEVVYNLSVSDNLLYYEDTPTIYYDDLPVIYYDSSVTEYLDAAPASGLFRYDAFVVGEDSVIDYLKGTDSANPVKPTVPVDHLLIDDYILVIGGITEIENRHIGMQFTIPVISSIDIDIEGNGINYTLPYDDGGGSPPQYTEVDIVFTLLDQYLNQIDYACTLNIDNISGDGDFWSLNTGYDPTSVSQLIDDSTYTFRYRREQDVDSGIVIFSGNVTISGFRYELIGIITLEAP